MNGVRRRKVPLYVWIILAIGLGAVTGLVLGKNAAPLSQVGTLILDMIKGLAGPLILFAILDAFLKTEIDWKSGLRMVSICTVNAAIAVAVGLGLSNLLHPGKGFLSDHSPLLASEASSEFAKMSKSPASGRSIDFVGDLIALVPTSLFRPIVENTVFSIVILAVLLGAALRRIKTREIAEGGADYLPVEQGIATIYRAIEVVLGWIVLLVPIAVFGVVAKTIGQYGVRPLGHVGLYLAVGIAGLLFQVLVVYQAWLLLVARMPLKRFWSAAREAIVTALGTASSMATLPKTLECLDRLGVSKRSARLAACVGTNLNNDGILLYEAMAVLFVAQALGIDLSLGQQLVVAFACIIAGIGISGVPEAGLISLLVVLQTVKMPADGVEMIVPFLLSVDWVLGRCRAMTNVTSDMLVAVLLDRFDGAGGFETETPREGGAL
jgi:Na+/H+-dicarboxylate symporter